MPFTLKIINNKAVKTIRSKEVVVLDMLSKKDEYKYFACRVNNRLRPLTYKIHYDAAVEFLDLSDVDAVSVYNRGLRYIFSMAVKRLYPNVDFKISYSVSRSMLVEPIDDDVIISDNAVEKIREEMQKIIDADFEFERMIVSPEEAVNFYKKFGYNDKIRILEYRPEKTVHFYKCDDYLNYMYGIMVPSTGYLNKFNLINHSEGIILQYPRSEEKGEIPEFVDAPVFANTLKDTFRWGKLVGTGSVAGVNKFIENYGSTIFINMCEDRHNKQFVEIGDKIEENISNIRLICIAGPSSSGKTTFANRLRVELLSRGINSIRISIDDYYKTRDQVPLDKDGNYDFEDIKALDIERFNKDMLSLVKGNEVTTPRFNFKTGKIEKGDTFKLTKDDVIIIEGIHALNPILTNTISDKQKFQIYIAPVTQIYLDNQNPMSITDLRLLRRIVRDYKYRNSSPEETISMWPSVRRGEFKWIYDTQENADYVFNSYLNYELPVLKKYAEPLLKEIPSDSIYFPDAERLIRMLKYFKAVDDSLVPNNSIMREFIGGSVYEKM